MSVLTSNQSLLLGILLPGAWFVLAGGAFTLCELVFPMRPLSRRLGFAVDALGLTVAWLTSGFIAMLMNKLLMPWGAYRPDLTMMPLLFRGLLYFVLSDFSRFFTHWLMHRQTFWPAHRFHHSVQGLYWFSGNRASVIHVALFMAPMALWGWVLDVGAFGVAANVVLIILWNDIMHTNARLSPSLQRLLEWVVTTPRYHHIHHSEDPQHRGVNLASILTIWDRLARTYVDPDRVDNLHLVFGSEDAARRPIWRSLIGV